MAYAAGRMQIFVDLTTAKDDYTNETFNSMSLPLVNQLCTVFGMHIITDLTMETARGYRYFIGYDDDDPKMAIGWAVNNTYSTSYYLLCVGMFNGGYLNNTLDAVSSSSISDSQYCMILLNRNFSNTTNVYFFFSYLSDTNFKGISYGYGIPNTSTSVDAPLRFCIFTISNKKIMAFGAGSYFTTYEIENNGLTTILFGNPTLYFINCKNKIANSDCEYIVPLNIDHGIPIEDVYLYSRALTARKIFSINNEYYYCFSTSSYDGSYLLKVNYTP